MDNVVVIGSRTLGPAQSRCEARHSTFVGSVVVKGREDSLTDCIAASIESAQPDVAIEHCNVYGPNPFIDLSRPGKGCFSADPQFLDPANLDYRLAETSPCKGKASDGGDIGCRYTPQMTEMCQIALKLRAQGIIDF